MGRFILEQIVGRLASLEGAVLVLWIGLVVLSIILFILSHTRWGQERLLRKCLALSILAHVLMVGYASTVKIVAGLPAREPAPVVEVSLEDGDAWEASLDATGPKVPSPWASHHDETPAEVDPLEIPRADLAAENDSHRQSIAEELATTPPSPIEDVAMVGPIQPNPDSPPKTPGDGETSSVETATPIDAPQPERRDAPESPVPDTPFQRAEVATVPGENPVKRTTPEDIVSSLLEQQIPLPRLSDLPTTVEPNPILAGPVDTATAGRAPHADLHETAAAASESSSSDFQPSPLAAADTPAPAALANLAAIAAPSLASASGVNVGNEAIGSPVLGRVQRELTTKDVPRVYQLRVATNRSEIAKRYGATSDSEAAVRAALKWLADSQESDGRWDPARHGAGKELRVLGRDRFGAGADADTGISALALLAFLASGHTHEEGLYRDNVRRGLEFLLRSQASDGNLGGKARTYAFMYCHGMATFALSEAYGMTGDRRLEGAVRRAVLYTVTAQNPTTGGWRYNAGDEGDTSQLGWQLMALKSAELAGIPMPAHTRQGAIRFLESVSSGRFGGLAAYRPVELPSRPMTAEALACRHFLGITADPRATTEAAQFLIAEVPGEGEANFYYWYYATLGLYQTQSEAWDQWNAALQRELLARQRNTGDLAGSWDPNTVWGGYGGRVYTTALATLCLEIYYRFMPLYVEAAAVSRTLR